MLIGITDDFVCAIQSKIHLHIITKRFHGKPQVLNCIFVDKDELMLAEDIIKSLVSYQLILKFHRLLRINMSKHAKRCMLSLFLAQAMQVKPNLLHELPIKQHLI